MRSDALAILRSRLLECSVPARAERSVALPFEMPLAAGRLHEWFVDAGGHESVRRAGSVGAASAAHADAPLCLFVDLARRALTSGTFARVAWVGCPLYPNHAGKVVCRASIVVDPPTTRDSAAHVWAIDLLLRSGTPVLILASVKGLTLAHTRRLQLAAASGRGVCMVARPARELSSLSAAATRWRVEPAASPNARPRWTVTLLRNKDQPAPSLTDERAAWTLELNGATGVVHIPAVAGDGSAAAGVQIGERAGERVAS